MKIRIADVDDIDTLVSHRRLMFLDISFERYSINGIEGLDKADTMYKEFLTKEISCNHTIGIIVQEEEKIIASGCVTFIPWPSEPLFLSNTICHIHSVYTIPEERTKGYARLVMSEIENQCKKKGQKVMILWASKHGKPLYYSIGYEETPSCMMKISN